ncbi:DMT family transporter [Ruegeria sp. 2205SS24-7]|uniref:DMT family transporter n=1 Tax=Ruegeria discodermiae TaxID=3064389 RepID=UPI00274225E7|nr:DMT family transporter [Ruegeria sp. 2205SS24-7]MDP5217909.1 DMT family transporter [Ruegeria sp. 2205SS24-7]
MPMPDSPPQRPLVGILWMLAAGVCFVLMTALVKVIGNAMHPVQLAFLRYILGLVFVLPVIRPLITTRFTRRQWALFGIRGALQSVAVMLWFFAMTQIPLAEVTAMNYLTPIYVTLGAVFLLGERLALRRITAIGFAFIGALIILRPGFREVSAGHLAMLGTTLLLGGAYLLAKVTVDEVRPALVLAQMSIWVAVFLAPFAVVVWQPFSPSDLGFVFLVATMATAGHYCMTRALQAAPVAVTQPATFLQLVWSVALGALAFDEGIDPWVVAGGTLILASVSFISWREAALQRRQITPVNLEPKL